MSDLIREGVEKGGQNEAPLTDRPVGPIGATVPARRDPVIVELESLIITSTTEVPEQAGEIISSGEPFRLTVITKLTPDLKTTKEKVDKFLEATAPTECPDCHGLKKVDDVICAPCEGLGEIPFRIHSRDEYTDWLKAKQGFNKLDKDTDEGRKKVTRPIDAWKNLIMSLVNPIHDDIKTLDKRIRDAVLRYDKEAEDAERKRQLAITQAQRAATIANANVEATQLEVAGHATKAAEVRQQAAVRPLPVLTASQPVVPKVAGVAFKMVWKWFMEDEWPEQFYKPRELDEAKVRAHLDMMGQNHGIAGLNAWQEKDFARTGTGPRGGQS